MIPWSFSVPKRWSWWWNHLSCLTSIRCWEFSSPESSERELPFAPSEKSIGSVSAKLCRLQETGWGDRFCCPQTRESYPVSAILVVSLCTFFSMPPFLQLGMGTCRHPHIYLKLVWLSVLWKQGCFRIHKDDNDSWEIALPHRGQ